MYSLNFQTAKTLPKKSGGWYICNLEQAFGEEVIPIKVVLCNVCQNKFILLYPYDFVNISTLLNGIERAGR